MRIKVTGKSKKVPIKLCRTALRFYGKILLSKQQYNTVKIHLIFTKEGLGNSKALSWTYNCNTFYIQIHPMFGQRNTLRCLSHEMTHIKQWMNGELTDIYDETKKKWTKCKWKGKIYPAETKETYWLSPWELEIHGYETCLYKTFIEGHKDGL